jgi:hypothetical protein
MQSKRTGRPSAVPARSTDQAAPKSQARAVHGDGDRIFQKLLCGGYNRTELTWSTAQMKKSNTENRLGAHSRARKIWLRMKPNTGYKIRKDTSSLSLLTAQNAGPVLSPGRPGKSKTKLRTEKAGPQSKEEPKAGKDKLNHGQCLPRQET